MNAVWLRSIEKILLNVDVFNLLNINNVNSFYWVSNIYNQKMAVPNYLTGRMFNFRITVDF
jgi:hypothetical protein